MAQGFPEKSAPEEVLQADLGLDLDLGEDRGDRKGLAGWTSMSKAMSILDILLSFSSFVFRIGGVFRCRTTRNWADSIDSYRFKRPSGILFSRGSSFDPFKRRIANLYRYVKYKIHTYLIFLY